MFVRCVSLGDAFGRSVFVKAPWSLALGCDCPVLSAAVRKSYPRGVSLVVYYAKAETE